MTEDQHLPAFPSALRDRAALREKLRAWNATATPYPRECTIHDLFAESVRKAPDAVAVIAPEGEISYGDLEARSSALAAHLIRSGVVPGDLVALCAERSLEMVVGLLAILKAGAAYVPLDPTYPRERLAFLLEDTRAAALLAQEHLAALLPLGAAGYVPLDGWAGGIPIPRERDFAVSAVPATALAYVIYTSGSTGKPKGVAVPHRAVVRLVRDTDYLDLGPDDRVAQVANSAFDAATYEIWGALLNGGRLVIVPQAVVLRPAALAAAIRRHGITSMFLTTALFNQMAREAPGAFEPLNELLAGGEALDPSVVRKVLADRPPRRLLNVYGPTENTTFSTWHELRAVAKSATTVPIGRPIANSRSYALDPDFQPIEIGGQGLLYVAGDGLAHGYLHRPDLTAERFLPDPFAERPGERMYDTGDLVRLLADGAVEYLGRADQQVKIRGFRIEMGEVESALQSLPEIGAAAVLALDAPSGGKRLVAYAVPAGATPDRESLRAELGAKLPDYMVPSAFVWVETLPLTPNGKVDRRALSQLEPEAAPAGDFVAPRTPLEAGLAAIWAEVLALSEGQEIGVTSDFFALGGHSLLAARIAGAVQLRLGVDLSVGAIFEELSIERLAARIESEREQGGELASDRPVSAGDAEARTVPLSAAQRRLWFLDRLEPGSSAYNLAFSFRFSGLLRLAALEAALDEIERRHAALRTTFVVPQGGIDPVQVVHAPRPRPLPLVDLSALEAFGSVAEAGLWMVAAARQPFDLERGPLSRRILLRLGDGEHRLVATFHHAVFDGTSLEPFRRELRTLYLAAAAGHPSPLPEPPVQYTEFTLRQEHRFGDRELQRQLAYWRERLAGHQGVEISGDRTRPAVRSGRGAVERTELPGELAAEVDRAARTLGASPFMVLFAAFLATLHRYTGQDDLLVGTPVAGRGQAEAEGLLGFFVNTLPLRVGAEGEPSFATLVERVRASALGAFAHQDLPFERLVAEVVQERDLSRNPLFQLLFAFLDGWEEETSLGGGLTLGAAEEIHAGAARFDLSFHIHRKPAGLELWLEYSTEIFEGETVGRLARHFETLLRGALARPETLVAELPLLGETEREQLAARDRETSPIGPAGLLHELFEARVRQAPEAVALVAAGEVLTYAELDRRSSELARQLRDLGAGPETGVAVQLERRAGLIVTLLAVLRSGAFYVPIDPRYPEDRRAYLIEDSGACIVVTEQGITARGGAAPGRGSAGGTPLPANLAYLIYTSGSTGKPKAVAIPHAGAVQVAHWARDRFSPEELRGVLACTATTFDLSVFEIFVTLASGGAVILVEDALALLDGAPDLPAGLAITLVNTVPSAMAELLRAGALPPSVRTINLAGEALTRALADRVYERPETERLYNLYGPSEDTTYSTWSWIERAAERQPAIGRPVQGTRAYVLDRRGERLPLGVPGDLHLSGLGLARGYLGRPDLSADRFLPDPFAGEPGARMYRTGDLARLRADGELEYLGRLDHQVKIRGYRIELGEIETALVRLEGVRAATVLLREEDSRGPALVAYLAAAERPAQEIRQELLKTLPEPMVPGAFVFLEELPLTPHGKVDRKALTLKTPATEAQAAPAPLRTPMEVRVAAIWSELLERPAIGSDDRFFALGGHSLLAARLVSKVRSQLGIEIPLRAVFEAPTVAELAARIERAGPEGSGASTPPLVRVPRDGPLPASFAQRRLWFLDRLAPGGTAYNHTVGLRLEGPVDVPALAGALVGVVLRHEALRTVFVERGGEPRQVVENPGSNALSVVNLAGLPEAAGAAESLRIARSLDELSFDLGRGPLFRSALLRHGERRHDLLLGLHHIVSDGWSMDVLTRDLGALYRALSRGESPRLPELPVQYADYAAWQRELLECRQGVALEEQLDWWTSLLATAPRLLELPLDHPRPPAQSFRGHRARLDLPADLAGSFEATARGLGVTSFMASLAAFSILLARYSGQSDLVVGTPIANRGRAELEELIGFFASTLALRVDLGGNPSFGEIARRVREVSLGAFARQDVPFERLVDALRPERSLSYSPIFQVSLAFQNLPSSGLDFADLTASPLALEENRAPFDLSLFLTPLPDGTLSTELYAASDLFDPATSHRLLGHFRRLLEGIAAGSGAPFSELALLRAEEREEILGRWNRTEMEIPVEPVHRLFFGWAARTPEALAVAWDGGSWTYGELAARARALAVQLRAQGVGPETVVALRMGRSPELLAAAIAVLEAGGAYLPIDPAHPEARATWMAEDAQALRLVTAEDVAEALTGGPVAQTPASAGADDPEALAYVIYTSGSTGTPKGTELLHRGLSSLIAWHRATYRLGPKDRSPLLAGPGFDASVWETWAPLTAGASLHIPAPRVALSPPALLAWMAEAGITVAFLPTPLAEAVLAEPLPGGLALRSLLTGGDRLKSRPSPEAPFALFNHYGPTESTVVATAGRVATAGERPPEIGGPIANTRVHVLDRSFEPVPIGVAGELCIAAVGLARGYRFRPELTAQSFVPNPFPLPGGQGGERLYRTGDLARRLPQGEIEFVGRFDHQVKVRGFRIELGEVEAALAAHPEVESCVVLARADAAGDPRLVAYVVPRAGQELGAEALRHHLEGSLPGYMVPATYVELSSLPLDPNGKIDRRALPEPSASSLRASTPPRTPLEEVVAQIWIDTLGVSKVSVEDNFWQLGGHSLLATLALTRVEEEFGVEVPLQALFTSPVLADFASAIAERMMASQGSEELDEALAELEGLSDEEVRALLEQSARELEELQ